MNGILVDPIFNGKIHSVPHFYSKISYYSELDLDQCSSNSSNVINIIFYILLILGIILSYLPQHVRILKRKCSYGYSPYFLLLGLSGVSFTLTNAVIFYWSAFLHCFNKSFLDCAYSLAGFIQILTQFTMIFSLYILFMIHFPSDKKYHHSNSSTSFPSAEWSLCLRVAKFLTTVMTVLVTVTGILLIVAHQGTPNRSWQDHIYVPQNERDQVISNNKTGDTEIGANHSRKNDPFTINILQAWASLLGGSSALCSFGQYIPQIVKTIQSKRVGSLSILSMYIQIPGTAIFLYALIKQPGSHWSIWITYLVSALSQSILLVVCLYYRYSESNNEDDNIFNQNTSIDATNMHLVATTSPSMMAQLLEEGDKKYNGSPPNHIINELKSSNDPERLPLLSADNINLDINIDNSTKLDKESGQVS